MSARARRARARRRYRHGHQLRMIGRAYREAVERTLAGQPEA